MRNVTQIVCAFAALTAASPALVQAQTTTAFDGTYRGVSRTTESSGRSCTPTNDVPATLTIVNGSAQSFAINRPMQGSVTPQGTLVMRTDAATLFQGQIDSRGAATGALATFGCSYKFVWQK